MATLHTLWDFLLANPARLMVLVSLGVTLLIGHGESSGRHTGGSGWLTLVRLACGAVFTIATVVVATIFDGVRGFFVFGTLQVLICLVIPALWVEAM